MRSTTTITALSALAMLTGPRPFVSPSDRLQAPDACSLLTVQQVSAALGTTVESGKLLIASNPRSCGWAPAGGPKIGGKKVTLTLISVQSFETGKKPVQGIEKSALSGVGDDAVYITTPPFDTALNVKKGNSAFQIRVGGFKTEEEKAIEKALAPQVLARM